MEKFETFVKELCTLPDETTWVEFKHNNYEPKMIGKDISALANSAALASKEKAYMIWGVDDKTHEIVGTDKTLQSLKVGNQELENWLRSLLSDNAAFEFHQIEIDGCFVGVLIIDRAVIRTVAFEKVDYIRVGSYTKKLSDVPSMQGPVWDKIRNVNFEEQIVTSDLEKEDIGKYLEYSVYFKLLDNLPQPDTLDSVIHYLSEEHMLVRQDNGLYGITNLGALVLGKELSDFKDLKRKAVRVVRYEDASRMEMLRDETFASGYAVIFEDLIKLIELQIPSREKIVNGIQRKRITYPILVVREAVANAMIHQDLSSQGAGPLIEIFSDRIEITNVGDSLVDISRIIDNPPKSRNEKMTSLMRKLGFCEDLGSGWDRMVALCERQWLPVPKIVNYDNRTRVVLVYEKVFRNLTMEEKLWALYMHACLKYVKSEQLSNSSLRERFGLKTSSSGSISRLIKEAVQMGRIKPVDPDTAPRYMRYVPYWA